jgi:TonB family protein
MSLGNLFQWSVQLAVITLAGAVVMRLVRIDAPVLRHAFWRMLLLIALALPLLQPWVTPVAVAESGSTAAVFVPSSTPVSAVATPARPATAVTFARAIADHWLAWIGFVLAAGIVVRIAWLAAGILRLRRLCRAGATAPASSEYDDLVGRIRARAEIRYVPRLGQPVTFGVLRPVVLLPEWFPSLTLEMQRAVLAHELWHVQRRDWGWVLIEESLRAVLWFNPAASWLVSRVQATREEVVDELTVQLTNARKAYLEALLVFADEPTLFPATPFARRRHLFHRMLLISREAVMSSRRIITSLAVSAAVVVVAGWYGVAAFPLTADRVVPTPASPSAAANRAVFRTNVATQVMAVAQNQNPPRDRRPGEAAPETTREREIQNAILANRSSRELYFQLADLQIARGAGHEAAATLSTIRQLVAGDVSALTRVAQAYNKMGRFNDTVDVLEQVAAIDSADPRAQQIIATFYWEKAFKDAALTPPQRLEYIRAGVAATDKALGLNPDYVDALVYKNILLRMEANLSSANRDALIAEADALRSRAMELQRARNGVSGGVSGGVPGGMSAGVAGGVARREMEFVPASQQGAPPPPPPPPPPTVEAYPSYPPPPPPPLVDGMEPVRVGGPIKPPVKIRDVKPAYPPIAQAAGVQGVVIIQAVIDTTGNIHTAVVLRGQPLLDEAALDAVKGWQFQPTQVNGVTIPVVMTVTVNFTMDR